MMRLLLASLLLALPFSARAAVFSKYPLGSTLNGYEVLGPVLQSGSDVTITSGMIASLILADILTGGLSTASEAVTGNSAIGGTLSVTGSATIGGTLGVTGAVTDASETVIGSATIGGTLSVTGGLTDASETILGNATIGGSLGVTGAITAPSAAISGSVSGTTGTFSGAVVTTDYSYYVPSTGATVTAAAAKPFAIVNPSGTLANLTWALPAGTADGAIFSLTSTQAITSLSISTSAFVYGNVGSLAAGSTLRFRYLGAPVSVYVRIQSS